jgi:hypothetical protein
MKSGNLNFLETSGPLQAYNATALHLPYITAFHPNLKVGSRGVTGSLLNISDITSQKTKGTGKIPYATHVYSVMTDRATGYSPVELLFGHRVRVPSSLQKQPTPRYNYDDYVKEMKVRIQAAHVIVRSRLLKSKTKSKLDYDMKTVQIALKVGDGVLLFDESVQRGR